MPLLKTRNQFTRLGQTIRESVTTFHFGHVGADERWLQYRHLFSEVPENDFATFTKENQVHSWRMVQVPGEYFEDEDWHTNHSV